MRAAAATRCADERASVISELACTIPLDVLTLHFALTSTLSAMQGHAGNHARDDNEVRGGNDVSEAMLLGRALCSWRGYTHRGQALHHGCDALGSRIVLLAWLPPSGRGQAQHHDAPTYSFQFSLRFISSL